MPTCPTENNAEGARPPVIVGNQATRINDGPPPTAMPAPGETAQQRAMQNSTPEHAAKVAEVKQLQERRQAVTNWQRQHEDTWPR